MSNDSTGATLLTAGSAARILKVSRQTVHNMAADGRLSVAYTVDGPRPFLLFDPVEVDRAAHKAAAPAVTR